MRTVDLSNPRTHRSRILTALASLALALPAQGSFHLMQIEQVIGLVNGDTTAQAVQLRMRSLGENFVSGATLVVVDASGNNPITLLTFPSNVINNAAGNRILITTANFASYETSPISPDFTMTNTIPASYMTAGRLIYRKPTFHNGDALWSVSWGGADYTGSNTGTMDNDADGNFAPPFPGVLGCPLCVRAELPNMTSALRFGGPFSAPSTNNAADYALTTGVVTFTNNAGASTSLLGGTPTPTPSTTPGSLGNISTRLRVDTGDNALIGGFIVTGTQPKKIIVRAIGPSIPITGALADPTLELRDSAGALVASNDNWRSSQEAEITATGIPPGNDFESAIVATLLANNAGYTTIVRGVNNGTGIGLVEAYDLDRTVDSKLGNISTRGLVGTENSVLIGGLIVLGQDPLRVIVRAIGPSLPVPGALGNPTLELRDSSGVLVAANDNWRTTQEAEIIATGIPPGNDFESAIVQTLPANGAAYTAIVRGVGGTTGVALVEVYALH